MTGQEHRPILAVHGLRTSGAAALWWEDSTAGQRLMRADGSAARPVDLPRGPDRLEPIAHYPGPGAAAATLFGHPGGDYGYLSEVAGGGAALARRPSVVWLPRAPGGGSGFVYTRFPDGSGLTRPPVDGLHVALHRAGTPFDDDEILLADLPGDSLVTLEAAAEPGVVLLKIASRGAVAYRLLHLDSGAAGGRTTRLPVRADARTKVALGAGRWWQGRALGTPRAALLATPPGTFDDNEAVQVELPEGASLAYFWATRDRVVLRTVADRAEYLVAVDNDTLQRRVITRSSTSNLFPEIMATAADTCAAWLRMARRPDAETAAYVEILDDGDTAPRAVGAFSVPRGAPATTDFYRAHDGARLPVQISGSGPTLVLLEHGGITALATAPLERALEGLAAAGEITLVRAVTRSLVPAHRVPGGERGYNDLLAAAEWVHGRRGGADDGSGRRLVAIGQSMGAVAAARAAFLRPDLVTAAVLRFPVTDLVGFPDLGIGRHWIPMLGDPGLAEHRCALERLSPLHMPLPDQPLPAFLIQVGTYDTRADPRHGGRFAARLAGRGGARLEEYAVGHVERFADPESRRAVRDVTDFLRTGRPQRLLTAQGGIT